MKLNQVTIPCRDYAASVRFYLALGLQQIVDAPPDYARFETDAGTTLSLYRVDAGEPAAHGVVVYFEVEDVDATVAALRRAGIAFDTEPTDERWLWREARLEDPAGNRLCIYHAGRNRLHPPWRIDSGGGA